MTERLDRARILSSQNGVDALLVTPGADLRYLTGYAAKPLERLTCLVVTQLGSHLVVPGLERSAAEAAGVSMPIVTWDELDDPFAIVAHLVGDADVVAVDDQMWASRVFALQEALPEASLVLGGQLVSALRAVKDDEEVQALRDAGAAIDRVHARMGEWLRPGRTEREVGADIARAIVEEGHEQVDFVIVGSGPNGASPHHEVSDRVIGAGEPVVVDIGGTNAAGYCSDSTRNYVAGGEPDPGYIAMLEVLKQAQQAQREYARPGVTAESVDAIGRQIIADAGYGDRFIHRTGHGIGQETHEEPYIVEGNRTVLEPGMAFSIEPGIYVEGQWGARIEDIVVCTQDGLEVLNNTPRDLVRL
ncbi:aminopeptidase P family protein [Aeromicrobium senzhongii]|uniref:Aminopeptidase P family protein n=1 Tax=Aeromicrobium senzhongii TaxID=2663859 RepID=A0ABX6SPV7_9ACTN|nr:Xaa-Pro peptidase family protein [Aeromicrobium senzhongii]MTB87077.1 M24 family metallopeptidase [Aeromicrobium senzhongii]QNL93107.1 aminopeptidase P family protein [Aeromicrobium senzhongii]